MSFRSWGPKNNPLVAIGVATTQTNAPTPAGFAGGGGQVRVVNGNSATVILAFYQNSKGVPTLSVPASGAVLAPPAGRPDVTVVAVPPNSMEQVSISLAADSVSSIGLAVGSTVVLVQRGDG